MAMSNDGSQYEIRTAEIQTAETRTAEIRTANAEETQAVGQQLGRLLFPGAVIGLEGDLGAGKTCFVKGIAAGLGLDSDEVISPTFTLIAEHYTHTQALYHIDLYRLEGVDMEELGEELGLEEYLFGQGVTAIEWFQFLPAGMCEAYLLISLRFGIADERIITLTAYGQPYESIVQAVCSQKLC